MAKKTKHTIKKSNTPAKPTESFYNNVKEIIEQGRKQAFRAVNTLMVKTYWEIGRVIFREEQQGKKRADYGSYLIAELSKRLTINYGKGFDESNLRYMRLFYKSFAIRDAVRHELSWTHYRLLLKIEKEEARAFYIEEAIASNWSTRTLERQMNSLYYERMYLTEKKSKRLVKAEAESKKVELQPKDIIKDPYVLEFLDLKPNKKFQEHELEQGLIDKLQEFLLELGKGFSFVGRQYRMSAETEHFYIDLVFYNYILKCFVLIDLKTGKLTHQDIGQMDMYVRMFEETIKPKGDNPTIGLILCADKNKTVVKYSLLKDSKQIFASKYKLYLPTVKELEQEIERERDEIEIEKKLKK